MTPEDFREARRYFEGAPLLYLSGLELTPEQTLIVTVDEASAEEDATPLETGDAQIDSVIGPALPITTRSGHRRFVVEFNPLVHAVTDETYFNPELDEDFSSPLRRREESLFLDWARARTHHLGNEAVGPLSHLALVTLDVVIDVCTRSAPEITVITLTDADLADCPPWER